MRTTSAAFALLALAACSSSQPPDAHGVSPSASTSAAAVEPSASSSAAVATAPTPSASASAPASAAAPAMEAAPTAIASAAAPLPNVKVANIGMHIGGGPNDAETKAPIKKSVEPRFDDFKRCWSKAEDATKAGDFGIDLLIPKDGGKAETSHVRSQIKGKDFVDCVVSVFQTVDFMKPKKGLTKVSYSLRFTP